MAEVSCGRAALFARIDGTSNRYHCAYMRKRWGRKAGLCGRALILLLAGLVLGGCSGPAGSKLPPPDRTFYGLTGKPADHVTRSEALMIAGAYWRHQWHPTTANVLHGADADGIPVQTPDSTFRAPGIRPGWWRPGAWNTGVPYQWGGFASLEEFDRGLRQGLAAGDVYTQEKRALLESAVSAHAVGIDCSGLVSRCWKLSRPYSTRELPSICETLSDYRDLLPGDILNVHNDHVLLFAGWADPGRTKLIAFEAGSPPTWKVLRNTIAVEYLKGLGYQPLRYRGMID